MIDITRVAKVVKGGRTFGFRVTAVVGDNTGQVGMGIGKARTVPDAIAKATQRARKDMHPVPIEGTTIPHEVVGVCGGARVMLRPATPGTGVIAGGGVRAVLGAAGVRDADEVDGKHEGDQRRASDDGCAEPVASCGAGC